MASDLSDRARAILDAVERVAAGRSAAVPPGPAEALPAPAAAPVPGAPRFDWSLPAPGAGEPVPVPATPPGQILAIVDEVVRAAEGARRRLDELSRTLDELARRVDAAGRGPGPGPADAALAARDDAPRAAGGAPRAAGASARLTAVEMAASGATRMEVDRRLRDAFGLRETHVLLDEIFGADSPPGSRLSWGGDPAG